MRGLEQSGTRPAVVVSGQPFNSLPQGICVVALLTTTIRDIPTHMRIDPSEGGVKHPTVVMCDQLRTVSLDRLQYRRGMLRDESLERIRNVICLVFQL